MIYLPTCNSDGRYFRFHSGFAKKDNTVYLLHPSYQLTWHHLATWEAETIKRTNDGSLSQYLDDRDQRWRGLPPELEALFHLKAYEALHSQLCIISP